MKSPASFPDQADVAIIGTGGFGMAMALVAHEAGRRVTLWGRDPQRVARIAATRRNPDHLPHAELPLAVAVTDDLARALDGVTLVLAAVPTQHLRSVIARGASYVRAQTIVVSLAKGIELGTRARPSEILAAAIPTAAIAVLSGPSHAEEIVQGHPTTVVVASQNGSVSQRVQSLLSTPRFRIYTNPDVLGVELAGACKNVIAIAAGILDGLGLGDNTKAALITRGLAEIVRLGVAMGAQRETFHGLAGIGDLMTTCYSRHGRNRAFGEALAHGETLESYMARTHAVVEGAFSVTAILELAAAHGVDLPITREVAAIASSRTSPRDAITALMTRSAKPE